MTDRVVAGPPIPMPAIAWAVLKHPSLWWAGLRQLRRMVPRDWWRTRPFLPVPPSDYLEFRLVTQYGGGHGATRSRIEPADVVDYLRWCRSWKDGR